MFTNLKISPRVRRWLDGGLLLGWMALIFVISAQPKLPDVPSPWFKDLPSIAGHVLEYAILALLWWRVLSPEGTVNPRVLLIAFALTLLYAISDEWHQRFVPNRHADVWDIVIDAGGALLALFAIWYWKRNPRWKG